LHRGQFLLKFQTSYQQVGIIYNNSYNGFILRYISAHQAYSEYLISFIITVFSKDIFLAMIVKVGFTACPKSESEYLLKFMKMCTYILDT